MSRQPLWWPKRLRGLGDHRSPILPRAQEGIDHVASASPPPPGKPRAPAEEVAQAGPSLASLARAFPQTGPEAGPPRGAKPDLGVSVWPNGTSAWPVSGLGPPGLSKDPTQGSGLQVHEAELLPWWLLGPSGWKSQTLGAPQLGPGPLATALCGWAPVCWCGSPGRGLWWAGGGGV